MYLLDTNACLDFLLARRPGIAPRIARAFGSLIVSSITVAQLRVGNRGSEDPEHDDCQLALFLGGVRVAPFDDVAARAYGSVMRLIGIPRSSFDRLIAAHGLALGATLVINNGREFVDVPGLVVENWTL